MSSVLKQCVIPTKVLALDALLGRPKGRILLEQTLAELSSECQEIAQLAWKRTSGANSSWVLELGPQHLSAELAAFASGVSVRITEKLGLLYVRTAMQYDRRRTVTAALRGALDRTANRCVNTVLARTAARLMHASLTQDIKERLPSALRQNQQAVEAALARASIRPVQIGQRVVMQSTGYYKQYR